MGTLQLHHTCVVSVLVSFECFILHLTLLLTKHNSLAVFLSHQKKRGSKTTILSSSFLHKSIISCCFFLFIQHGVIIIKCEVDQNGCFKTIHYSIHTHIHLYAMLHFLFYSPSITTKCASNNIQT